MAKLKHRYTIELSDDAMKILEETAEILQINKSETVRKSISLLHYLAENKINVLRVKINNQQKDIIL